MKKRYSGVRAACSLRRKRSAVRVIAGTACSSGSEEPVVRGELERTKALILAAVRVWEAKRQHQG